MTKTNLPVDYSTINLERLRTLPLYQLPKGFKVSDHLGSGCFMDAPGFPSYFIQSVYTSRGDTPRNGPHKGVIADPDRHEEYRIIDTISPRWLWNKVSMESERFKIWERTCYSYFKNCYYNPDAKDNLQVMPYKVAILSNIPLENHQAVRCIRQFYPEYKLNDHALSMIINPPDQYGKSEDWWERSASPDGSGITIAIHPIENLKENKHEDEPAVSISTLLVQYGIEVEFEYGTAPTNPEYSADSHNWMVTFKRGKKTFIMPFYAGSGWKREDITAEMVLSSLFQDIPYVDMSFEEFCSELGYDADSRRAERIYNTIIKQEQKLKDFLGEQYKEFLDAE